MKNALILHGTNGSSQENWFPWLKDKLESVGYTVWVPDLPGANEPNIQRYNQFLFENKEWQFNDETILVGHSSGAVAILGLLQALPDDTYLKAVYLVGSFKDELGRDDLAGLFAEPFDFEKIKLKSSLFYFLHSDNDPYCPLDHAEYLQGQIGGDLIVLPGQKHFSVGTYGEEYQQFPYLFHLIAGDVMTGNEVVAIYEELEDRGVKVWLDGGWGVDALLEKQTRPHSDLDIAIQKKDLPAFHSLLTKKGYWQLQRGDTSPHNFMLSDNGARLIDVHVIELDKDGNGIYGPPENDDMYPAAALLGKGKVNGKEVRCISPEWMVKFHSGYKLRKSDFHDVLALCEKFEIEVPREYK
jgi:lincosamide nucleotidyltransferase A/C/D/E